jgi:ferrochelatase
MRYQKPTIQSALRTLLDRKVEHLLVIPLFPHYAMSSYESAAERVKDLARQHAPNVTLDIHPPFYNNPHYIRALGVSSASYLQAGFDHLLFSFHGIPERHIRKSDPTGCHCLKEQACCEVESPAHQFCYRAQCYKTVMAFINETGIPKAKCSFSFQSRLGRDPWLSPYTEQELVRLARAGVKKLLVISPSFVSDCLETLEEIGIRGQATFLNAGGTELIRIPCLNDRPEWLRTLERMVNEWAATADAKANN